VALGAAQDLALGGGLLGDRARLARRLLSRPLGASR
jgi:hypothetical protein